MCPERQVDVTRPDGHRVAVQEHQPYALPVVHDHAGAGKVEPVHAINEAHKRDVDLRHGHAAAQLLLQGGLGVAEGE